MQLLLESFDRAVYVVPNTRPAVFLLADREGGGILINSPAFDAALLDEIQAIMPLKFIFYPSHFGARDVDAWRAASRARAMAYGHESRRISGTIDLVLERENRFSRTIDFLPMSGRTTGSCALRCKNKPGIVFFGPILSCEDGGWPKLVEQADDISFETRMIGALGLQDLRFEYAFTDDFDVRTSQYGPGADKAVQQELAVLLA
jgi:hypothetical protein